MSTPRSTALENAVLILEILRRIPQRRFITSTELHSHLADAGFECDLRTIQRHLDVVCQHFGIECDTRGKPYGYRWNSTARGFNLPLLSPPEALLLQLAHAELKEILPSKTLSTLAPMFASAQRQLDVDPQAMPARQWLRKVRRIPERLPLLPARIAPNVFEAVSDALYHERKLALHYRNARGERKEATVCPLGIAQQGSRLYLVCRFDGYDNERILALPRIERAEALIEHFVYPPDFDLARYEGEGHFAFGVGQQIKLHFFIDKATGMHLTESPLSRDQIVVEHDNALEITATVIDSALLHQWLRGWGEQIWQVERQPLE